MTWHQSLMVRVVVLVLIVLGNRSAVAQQDAPVPDPDPERERQTFRLPDGFEINLFASDPMIAKPIQMNFDSRGRLWVASSEVYPQIRPGQEANDKVIVLEDNDGDGTADHSTVFADGLLVPTGIAPGDGGVYVANSTELVHLSDTDGDGKADARRVVLSGFGTEDTHHMLHTFRWGPDGALYFNQSIYIHSHVETPHGPRRLNGGGIWRFRPRSMDLEVFAYGLINPWGHRIDPWGQHFATDGAGGEGINYMVPGAVLCHRARGPSCPGRSEPRQPETLWAGIRQRSPDAGRLAGGPDHLRLPCPPRLPLRAQRRRRPASPRASSPN